MTLSNELWLHVFSNITDVKTLKAILSASHRFHALGLEKVLRTLVWRTPETTARRVLDMLDRPERCRIPRVLALTLDCDLYNGKVTDTKSGEIERISRCIGLFANLTSLTITGGNIPPAYFDTFRDLRRLAELTLRSCWVAALPPDHGSTSDENLDREKTLTVTKLHLHNVLLRQGEFYINSEGRIVEHTVLPEALPFPTDLLHRLESLEVTSSHSSATAEEQARSLILYTPGLVRLFTNGPQIEPHIFSSPDFVPPTLCAFSGSLQMAQAVLENVPALAALTVDEELAPTHAIELVATLDGALWRIGLTIRVWDAAVLRAIARALPQCEHISLLYRSGGPAPGFLLDLSLPSTLHTLALHPAADAQTPPVRRQHHSYSDYMRAYRAWRANITAGHPPATAPSEEQCREYVLAWGRRYPGLYVVSLVPGRFWHRAHERNEWVVREDALVSGI
ncbi:hypothetical protein FB451DRAFT_1391538 [Mycena latifolia]|nr:hypothetical protein FB451DRAFT_1391538 [Mycena latifolia]